MICGPIFLFDKDVKVIGAKDKNEVSIPIPHAYFKSILTENDKGAIHMWSFIMPNKYSTKPLSEFLVPTSEVEKKAGILLWEELVGSKIQREKNRERKMW